MNDKIAEDTIDDHKYLLQEVQNRAAIAYFAALNRNLSLYNALKKYCLSEIKNFAGDDSEFEFEDFIISASNKRKSEAEDDPNVVFQEKLVSFLELLFHKMMFEYDFLSVVMYPDLKNRRNFVHDAWLIAKYTENFELKMAISKDPYFFITRNDVYHLIKTHDDAMIEHMLDRKVAFQIMENISYKLVSIKKAQVDAKQQTPV